MWAIEDIPVIQPKIKEARLMVSDFVDQHRGFLCLTESEYSVAEANNPDFPKTARALLE